MQHNFTVATGWKIFLYFFAVVLFVGALASVYYFTQEMQPGWLIAAVVIALLTFLMLLSTMRHGIIIDDDGITKSGMFGSRMLYANEVKGYRDDGKNLCIEPLSAEKKKITLTGYGYIGNRKEMLSLIKGRWPDLDQVEHNAELEEIMADSTYGFTEEERSGKLGRGKVAAGIFAVIGFASILISFFVDGYGHIIVPVLLAMPVVAIVLVYVFNGLIRFHGGKNSAYQSVAFGLVFSAVGLLVRAFTEYSLFDNKNLSVPSLLTAAGVIAVLYVFIISRQRVNAKGTYWMLAIAGLAFGFGAIINVNCEFDQSVPQDSVATVLGKRISRGKHTSYYITLDHLGPRETSEEIDVSSSAFDQVHNGTIVGVHLKNGLLNIPWYYITL